MARIPTFTTIALACIASPAWSQSTPTSEPADAVIVTGSRIARSELDRLQPTIVVSGEAIEDRGQTNLIDAFSEIPAFGPAPSSNVGLQSSVHGIGQSYADFLSLGTPRTLTLVNGRRFVSSNTASIFGPVDAGQQVDLNAIPTKLIDRVEVVAVGARRSTVPMPSPER